MPIVNNTISRVCIVRNRHVKDNANDDTNYDDNGAYNDDENDTAYDDDLRSSDTLYR